MPLFADKQDAFMTVHELGVQQVMNVTAQRVLRRRAAGPSGSGKPDARSPSSCESNPMIAHVGFVEAYAVGPGAVQRVEDSHVAFTIFLQEGYQQQLRRAPPPTRLALEAIITTIFEIVYRQSRASSKPRSPGCSDT